MKLRTLSAISLAALVFAIMTPTPASAAGTTISGVVSGTDGAEPGIRVGWLAPNEEQDHGETTTAADGSYSLSVPSGPYVLYLNLEFTAEKSLPGDRRYLGEYIGEAGEHQPLPEMVDPFDSAKIEPFPSDSGEPSVTAKTLDFELQEAGSIAGSVPASAGRSLRLLTLGKTRAGSVKADENGAFRFDGLSPGRYRVQLVAEGEYLTFTSPALTVRTGETTTFNPTPAQYGEISGVVRNGDSPLPNISVIAVRGDHEYFDQTDATGAYSIDDVPPGSYTVRFIADNSTVSGSEVSLATKTIKKVVVSSDATTALAARMAKGANLIADGVAGGYEFTLFNSQNRQIAWGHQSTFAGLSNGKYTLFIVNKAQTRYAKVPLNISRAGAVIVDPVPLSKRTVTLSGARPSATIVTATATGLPFVSETYNMPAYKYEVKGLVPGTYKVTTTATNHSPRSRRIVLDKSKTATLGAGSLYGGLSGRPLGGGVPSLEIIASYRASTKQIVGMGYTSETTELFGRGPSGVATQITGYGPVRREGVPYWYEFPASVSTIRVLPIDGADLGDIDLVLRGD